MSKQKVHDTGSRNVFKDIGVPNAEEHLVKAQLVFKIDAITKERHLKQTELANLFGHPPARRIQDAARRIPAILGGAVAAFPDGAKSGRRDSRQTAPWRTRHRHLTCRLSSSGPADKQRWPPVRRTPL